MPDLMYRRQFRMAACIMHGNLSRLAASGIQKSAVHSMTQRKTLEWNSRELAVLVNGINSRECATESIAVRASLYVEGCTDRKKRRDEDYPGDLL